MQVLLFKENSPVTSEYLHNVLQYKESIIEKLKLARILTHRLPKIELYEQNDEYIEEYVVDKECYLFNFVGIIMIENFCLVIYPKYIKDIEKDYNGSQKKIIQILNVIEKFQTYHEGQYSSDGQVGLLAMMISILRNYLDFGLYSSDKSAVEINGEGNILWEKTIDESTAYLIKDIPFYLDVFTEKNTLNELDIIRKLHAAIVSEIVAQLQPISSIFNLPDIALSAEKIEDFGDVHYLEYILEKELSMQFITSKQIILRELLSYILKKYNQEMTNSFEVYGTNSFNLVWEDICKKVYKDDLNEKLSSLGLKLFYEVEKNGEKKIVIDYREKKLLKHVVEAPVWKKKDSVEGIEARKSLELDVLHVNHERKRFEIFDAKYYSITFSEKDIFGYPGINDITKQYLYQLAFKKLAQINNYEFTNIFVIPKDELHEDNGDGVEYAMVELKILRELGLENIKVIARDCEVLYDQYLNA
ncbi:LlaJI family restriction endonuclease [Enterococcus sp. 3C7_DIV0644]|uniref:LlaJI family restriction endonuclease n=1 Tax=Enterococcus sp. 3C7_DIV0644 TaxID=1834174 RepID=UPI000A34BC0C|nr:LlaJI family restriction endonuclease [Enterococcus sp. 3C7_DIV0644]OTO26111.1 hypothetical protein A5877_001644 [Enterococcus sp. 3C7_DIV0644]